MSGLTKDDWLLDSHSCPGFKNYEYVEHLETGKQVHHTEYVHVHIPKRYAIVNIQQQIEEIVRKSKVFDGTCLISTHHITTGIFVNDAESGLLEDISKWIENLAPFGLDYRHHQTGEDNADSHLKAYLTNNSLLVPITGGRIDFGTWQTIFYAEFDGKRDKRITVKTMGMMQ